MKEVEIKTFIELHEIIEQYDARTMLKKTLDKYGVDQFLLFPGLDSLAAHMEWLQSKSY
ncbi:MAG TPA: hypothetical protein VK206_14940 [Anaerolineales bacterium]|nr:hypothetical protein [Anaerolineales bacterium]